MEYALCKEGDFIATIYDIAREVKLSAATVSRVLNGVDHPIREETRQLILKTAKEMDYCPNAIAKSLSCRKTYTVALLIPSITNYYYTEIAEVIEDILDREGYSVFLCNTKRQVENESRYIDKLIARKVDGVIFSSTRTKPEDNEINRQNIIRLQKYGIHTVAFGSHFKDVSQVHIDTYSGAYEAAEYLISLGHTRIGFIDGLSAGTRKSRRRGYIDALKAHGIACPDELVRAGNLEIESGASVIRELCSIKDPPTAIIAANHLMAAGAVKALKGIGYSIPRDISLIGFDDSKLCEMMEPSMTVVRQPVSEIGETAVRLLLNQIEGRNDVELAELKTRLIIRESCGKRFGASAINNCF